jgi:hypothetical protein
MQPPGVLALAGGSKWKTIEMEAGGVALFLIAAR